MTQNIKASAERQAAALRASPFFAWPSDLSLPVTSCDAPDRRHKIIGGERTLKTGRQAASPHRAGQTLTSSAP